MLYGIIYRINVTWAYLYYTILERCSSQSYQSYQSVTVGFAHFLQIFHVVFSVQATLKGEEKTKPAARRQTHTQGRFLVILTVRHIFLPYAKYRKKKEKKNL